MKRTHGILLFLTLVLTGLLVEAQSRSGGYIVWRRVNGREELRVPTNGDQAPSTVFNGTVLATGAAADNLSLQLDTRPDSSSQEPVGPMRANQTLIYDEEGHYLGAASQVSSGIYVAAAHVMDQLGEASLNSLLQQLNISSADAELYQLVHQSRPLDVVIILNNRVESLRSARAGLRALEQIPELQSGDKFSLVHYTELDGRLVEQQSNGSLSVSRDGGQLYLSNNKDARLTWGSSGAVVFAQKNGSSEWHMSGVVQCVVRSEIASSGGGEEVSYFRALSAKLISESELQPVTINILKTRRSHYNLEACGPVDAKKGGGG